MQGLTRTERAYLHLKTAIEQGRYPEGSALPTQPTLARTIGVSTVTLRQALERLAEEGFVEARHGQGTYVRSAHAVRGTVLVADDDPGIRNVLVDSLAHLGFEAEAVENGDRPLLGVGIRAHSAHYRRKGVRRQAARRRCAAGRGRRAAGSGGR